jgi:hypothetical protein
MAELKLGLSRKVARMARGIAILAEGWRCF